MLEETGEMRMTYDEILNYPAYGVEKVQKKELLLQRLKELVSFHQQNCAEYKSITALIDEIGDEEIDRIQQLSDIPVIPVQLFKKMELRSVPEEEIFKTMTSSGTTGQQVSKIFLDKNTASYQQKTLVKIVSDFTGSTRMPMVILDCPSVIRNRTMFSARGAGILGFSIFGAKRIYALDDDMRLDIAALSEFAMKYHDKTIFLFGFTFMIWQYVYKELKRSGVRIDLSNAVLIHGGGWKRLQNEAVSKEEFKAALEEVCGIRRENIHDYYGMVEQTGCIYMECKCGHLHASTYSDILIRRMKDFSVCDIGEEGIIQVFSMMPESYPGHSILTEDVGRILGEDDCPCGRKGKYFEVLGRMKSAEIRGCSDTFERGAGR